jgi:YidC/Oxa1 family membrane protein insertase
MFELLIVKPIFNLLVLIYGLLPGHNFGLSIILFTVLVRLLMWPLVKKQLHQAKAMREMQPEIKRIKQASKGNRQQESVMLMELYKERGISPFGSIGILIVQIIILLGLYAGLSRLVRDPQAIFANSYTFLHNLPGLKVLAENIKNFDATLFGVIDLTRPAINKGGGFYYPALYLVIGSAIAQFYQSKQLMPNPKDGRGLRAILREAGTGKKAEQAEVNAAVGKSTRFFLPLLIVFFTINLASALSLYWLTTGIVAYIQQARILGQDETEMEKIADQKPSNKIIEGEVIETPKTTPKKKKTAVKKRRKK